MVNILIEDDNIYYAKVLMNIINGSNSKDMKVSYIATDGQEALDIIKNHSVDIILLDLKMPIYDGLYILEEIEKEKMGKYKDSVIVVSGETDMICKLKESDYVHSFVNKASSISDIIDKIDELIKSKQEQSEEENIRKCIIKELQYLNYNLSHSGTQYLIDAIQLIYSKGGESEICNLTEEIYPIIAKKNNLGIYNIKSNISKANDYMYRICKIERIQKYFGFQDKTKPTVKNVIYTVLNKISKN